MSIYINDCNKVNDIFINVNGKKKINSMWVNKNGNPTKVFSTGNKINDLSNITWADGTDEEITAMLDAHYAGLIDIHDYWHVGDERVVSLGTFPTLTFGEYPHMNEIRKESQAKIILINEGGKQLVNAINGINECAFIVGISSTNDGNYYIKGQIDGEDDIPLSSFNFTKSQRRKWLNTEFKDNMILKTIFKYHKNYNVLSRASTAYSVEFDYFSLPSEKEVFGSNKYASNIAEKFDNQFEYFKTSENRPINCFLRSIYYSDNALSPLYVTIDKAGNPSVEMCNKYIFFYPFGCI